MKNYPKIICTLGTTTDSIYELKKMIKYGMDCVRINTEYQTTQEYEKRINAVKEIKPDISLMIDIKGPQIRLETDAIYELKPEPGKNLNSIVFDVGFKDEPLHFNKDFYDDVKKFDKIYFENGTIKSFVREKYHDKAGGKFLSLRLWDDGEGYLKNRMGVNVPGAYLNVSRLTKRDYAAIEYSILNKADYIALSFVRDYDDISNLADVIEEKKKELKKVGWIDENYNHRFGIVAKMEDYHGIKNLEDIIDQSKQNNINLSVMVARGDLCVEFPYEQLPFIQKKIISMCNEKNIKVITATGLLDSMQYCNIPSRSELCDVVNAVLDGSDALMLSDETSNGKNPGEAVKMLKKLIDEAKKHYKVRI